MASVETRLTKTDCREKGLAGSLNVGDTDHIESDANVKRMRLE